MSNKEHLLEDIKEIRSIMNRSSKFLSLSGLSGIMAGVYALIGATIAYYQLEYHTSQYGNFSFRMSDSMDGIEISNQALFILLICVSVAALSIITAYVLSSKKASKQGYSMWNATSRRLLESFLIPLCTGGLFILFTLYYGYYALVAPAMLVFYGLACVNSSKHTIGTIKYLGLSCIIIGLFNMLFLGYGLYFWAVGFGFCHIIYGTIMYLKHDRN